MNRNGNGSVVSPQQIAMAANAQQAAMQAAQQRQTTDEVRGVALQVYVRLLHDEMGSDPKVLESERYRKLALVAAAGAPYLHEALGLVSLVGKDQ